jgi:glycosyltransferase involved in cell wall biosynthesis
MAGTTAQHGADGHDPIPRETMAQLEARHWRDLATERDATLRSLSRRPLVRLATRLDRRLSPTVRRVGSWAEGLRPVADRAAVRAAGALARSRRAERRAQLNDEIARLPPAPAQPAVTAIPIGTGPGGLREAERAGAAPTDIVCFVPAHVTSPDPDWLARLAAGVGDVVTAATPTLVRSARTPADVTEHELLVAAEGYDLELDAAGAPQVVARGAGRIPSAGSPPADVPAATLVGLAVDRRALLAAGGVDTSLDADLAGIDLCTRLRRAGGHVRHVPDAMLFDDRPAPSRGSLRRPVRSTQPGWGSLVDAHGPALAQAAIGAEGGAPTRWVITTAAPTTRRADRWGDWHLAEALARALRRLGEDVVVQPLDLADDPATRSRDVHLVLHGLAPVRRTPGQRHVLWVISHPETLDDEECDAADLVLVASPRFAAELRRRTVTPVEVLLQATDSHRFHPQRTDPQHEHEVTIVAKTRGVPRSVVSDALAAGLRPAIYGSGWHDLVDPGLVVADHVDNASLPVVYSSAGVVLNDHWDTMRGWGFVSNRIFDVLACGTPVISDDLPEVHELFDDTVPTYRDPDELGKAVAAVLADPRGAREVAAQGRAIVLAKHTFDHRAQELLELLAAIPTDGRKAHDD